MNSNKTRVRTIREAVEYFRKIDPNTAIRECTLRRLVKTGAIPCLKIGNRQLVSIESIEDLLSSQNNPACSEQMQGSIRRVKT